MDTKQKNARRAFALTDKPEQSYDVLVFIGRFQIFHHGHLAVIREALRIGKHLVLFIGSANAPRSVRDPFSYHERSDVISTALTDEFGDDIWGRVSIFPLEDSRYNDAKWIRTIQDHVHKVAADLYGVRKLDIALIGHGKDSSSYYLKMFPQWDSVDVPCHNKLSSTPMREALFSNIVDMWLSDCDGHGDGDREYDALVPTATRTFLKSFVTTSDYKELLAEYEFVRDYKTQWAVAPYPVTFQTADAIVHQSGHFLLVRRGARPGKGLWALPGGYVNQMETIQDAAIRELVEETEIKVPMAVLRGSINRTAKGQVVPPKTFDDPYRSPRGRTITQGFLIDLPPQETLPAVRGGDDADEAKWWEISQIRRDMMFEDHHDILSYFAAYL